MEKSLAQMIEFMKLDIERHISRNFKDIGKEYYGHVLSEGHGIDANVAANFWEAWVDEKDHNFQGAYDDIEKSDWPILAKEVIECLEANKEIENGIILYNFDISPRVNRKLSFKKKALVVCALFISAVIFSPWWYFYFKLPSNAEVQPGAMLQESFRGFGFHSGSSLSKNDEFQKVVCLECLPFKEGSSGCRRKLSNFVAGQIQPREPSFGMLGWHIRDMYLSSAIESRYNQEELERLYIGFMASVFKEKDISAFCASTFKKKCSELSNEELLIFNGSASRGKLTDRPVPPFDHFPKCLQ